MSEEQPTTAPLDEAVRMATVEQDEKQAEKLRAFLEERNIPVDGPAPTIGETLAEKPEPPPPPPPTVPEDTMYKEKSVSNMMQDILADTTDAEHITEEDKENYLRSVLFDKSVVFDIPILKNTVVAVRAKSTFEQQMVFAVAQNIQNVEKLDFASSIFGLQRLSACLQVMSIDGKAFSNLELTPDMSLEHCQTLLTEARSLLFDNMSMPRWCLFLNALRVFEGKMAAMGTSVLQSNFWNPEG
jgi:hypothetical protein